MKRAKQRGPWSRYARGRNAARWNRFWQFVNVLDRVDDPVKGPKLWARVNRMTRQR